MNYHRRTRELLAAAVPLDPARAEAAVRSASAAGITLPPAVAEWYSVAGDSDLWRMYHGDHKPALWQPPGEPQPWWGDGVRPVWDSSRQEWWVIPPLCREVRGWINPPILPLMYECQGCWWWGVVLDGTADPPAVISYDEGETWDVCAAAFSVYVYAILFDESLYCPADAGSNVRIEAVMDDKRRRVLQEPFRAEPTTRGAYCLPDVFIERFSAAGQRFHFWNSSDHRFSHWRLWAARAAGFADLVTRLSRLFPGLEELRPGQDADWPSIQAKAARMPDGEDTDIPF